MLPIGQKLAEFRVQKRITQLELSKRTGIPQAHLSNIERGKHDLTVSTLLRVCRALGVAPADIFHKERRPNPFGLTRIRTEKLAKAVWDHTIKLCRPERKLRDLLSILIPEVPKGRLSNRRVYHAWQLLRESLGPNEIKLLMEKTREKKLRRSIF